MRLAVLLVFLASPVVAAEPTDWQELLRSGQNSPWKKIDDRWIQTKSVTLNPAKPRALQADPETGTIWVNGTTGRVGDLHTKQEYADCEVHVEFLLGKNSNSGIKFHDVYEIQLRDTAGTPADQLSGDSCGGIYPRAELKPRYHHIDQGIAPKVNAAKPAGEWQTLTVVFQAPRFDAAGKKIANAKIIQATLNGQVIHENQEMKTPTGNNWSKPEHAAGPFMLQADHGPVAFRNVKIRPRIIP
ncbi:MAG: DUF1080 domain-containing protein [Bacteroidales bacterium]|nr:DUF1080 domain-containing protein [Bacteroidales bacterium]